MPAPLTGNTFGATPNELKGTLNPSFVAFDTVRDERWLRLPDIAEQELQTLYAEPIFFKSVEIDESPEFRSAYRVAARLDHRTGPPLLIERRLGNGRVPLLDFEFNFGLEYTAKVKRGRHARPSWT